MDFKTGHKNCDGCTWYMLGEMDLEHCCICNKDGSCPCTICLVKVMCKDDIACEKYQDWLELNGYTREGLYKINYE